MSTVNDLAADIRAVNGENSLGAAALAEGLLALGWIKKPVKSLAQYRPGDMVEVFFTARGIWVMGSVSESIGGLPSVNTEYGPVTVASLRRIRPQE